VKLNLIYRKWRIEMSLGEGDLDHPLLPRLRLEKNREHNTVYIYMYMSEFMKTVLKTLHQNSGHVFEKTVRKCT